MTQTDESAAANPIESTADIVAAYVSNNTVPQSELPALIGDVHKALVGAIAAGQQPPEEPLKPAVPIKKSVTLDYIICLEDGKRFKSLKRHLARFYGLTPAEYRAKWGLPSDYPMVAPNYSAERSALAKNIGLGQKRRAAAAAAKATPATTKAAKHAPVKKATRVPAKKAARQKP